jgi:tetratricopeptide (TPR) repeat protein
MSRDADSLPRRREGADSFLLSRTQGTDRLEPAALRLTIGEREMLLRRFAELPFGPVLHDLAQARLRECPRFCVLALRLDSRRDPEGRTPIKALVGAAESIDAVCRPEGGLWGLLDGGHFLLFFPHRDAADGLRLAARIQEQLAARGPHSATAGAADFPLLGYSRAQVVDNALKAADHAAFYGPGGRAAFDAVSLNISGDRLYAEGNVPGAIAEFTLALALDPANVNVHNSLGVCHGIQGHLEAALASFESVMRLDAAEVMAVFNAGLVKMLQGDRPAALALFERAAALNGEMFEIPLAVGKLLLEWGRPAAARPHLEQAALRNPQSTAACRLLGECYGALGLREQAMDAYRRAIRLKPNDAESLSALGVLFEELGENREIALLFCRQSVEIAPENGLYHLRLGRVLQRHGRLQEAQEALQRAAALGQVAAVEALRGLTSPAAQPPGAGSPAAERSA